MSLSVGSVFLPWCHPVFPTSVSPLVFFSFFVPCVFNDLYSAFTASLSFVLVTHFWFIWISWFLYRSAFVPLILSPVSRLHLGPHLVSPVIVTPTLPIVHLIRMFLTWANSKFAEEGWWWLDWALGLTGSWFNAILWMWHCLVVLQKGWIGEKVK